jgi:protoporphyrin/coproporphyrin ferrochelatase
MTDFDAVLIVSFGGPEGPEDVMPFLRNVVRGKNIPDERLNSVAHHYELFDGISPINEQNRQLMGALRSELDLHKIDLPIYWGNRNWHPMLADTLKEMKEAGIKYAIAFVTSAYSSYSGCRQYREDIERARAEVGEGAPLIDKVPVFYDQLGFLEANEERLRQALATLEPSSIVGTHVAFTAHSIPMSMANSCRYQNQLMEVAQALATRVGIHNWKLVFQSRSGPPSQPWLEPDINDHIRSLHESGVKNIIVAPIGFVSDHMEIVYDLDTEASKLCAELGINMVRSKTVGTHPAFISMIRKLIVETIEKSPNKVAKDDTTKSDLCSVTCCTYSPQPGARPTS